MTRTVWVDTASNGKRYLTYWPEDGHVILTASRTSFDVSVYWARNQRTGFEIFISVGRGLAGRFSHNDRSLCWGIGGHFGTRVEWIGARRTVKRLWPRR